VMFAASRISIFAACVFASMICTQAQSEDVVRINSDLVNVFFSAVDRNDKFSTALAESDIALYEDNVRQKLFTFRKQSDRALSIAILIDLSASQKEKFTEQKKAHYPS
jgi:hypothetical protein